MRTSKRWAIAAVVVGGLPFAMAAECTSSKPGGPGGPQPEDNNGSCNITARQQNSAGQWYVGLDCDLDGQQEKAELLPNNDPAVWPKCNVNTYWPSCQTA